MKVVPKIIVVQRQTNVADKPIPSRSVYARQLEALEYLKAKGRILLDVIDESDLDLKAQVFDVLLFCKHSSERSLRLAEMAREMGKKVVYDIDDFLPAFPSYSGGQGVSKRIESIRKHAQMASVVTTATTDLRERIDGFFGVRSVLVPNGFNVERHFQHKAFSDKTKMIFTNADLIKVDRFKDGFFRTINQILQERPNVEFDIVTDPNQEMNRFVRFNNLGNISWFEHKKVLATGGYNLALIPLGGYEDQEAFVFNSCKSPIKYLEYGGLKIAGVYSKSPIYERVIKNGETGLLVENTESEWREAVETLLNDSLLRTRIAENAYEDVRANHHVSRSAEVWLDVLGG